MCRKLFLIPVIMGGKNVAAAIFLIREADKEAAIYPAPMNIGFITETLTTIGEDLGLPEFN